MGGFTPTMQPFHPAWDSKVRRKGQIHPLEPGTSICLLLDTALGEGIGFANCIVGPCLQFTFTQDSTSSRLPLFPIISQTTSSASQQGPLHYTSAEPQRANAPQNPKGESFNIHHHSLNRWHVYSPSLNYKQRHKTDFYNCVIGSQNDSTARARATGCKPAQLENVNWLASHNFHTHVNKVNEFYSTQMI